MADVKYSVKEGGNHEELGVETDDILIIMDIINDSVKVQINLDLDLLTDRTVFTAPEIYEDNERGESEKMLERGL